MTDTGRGVTRDAVDSEALALLRTDPEAYIRTTHRKLPFGFTKLRRSEEEQTSYSIATVVALRNKMWATSSWPVVLARLDAALAELAEVRQEVAGLRRRVAALTTERDTWRSQGER